MKNMLMFLLLLVATEVSPQQCQKRDFGNGGHVCVCNATFCDAVPPIEKLVRPQILIYTSNKAGLRFSQSKSEFKETNRIYENQIYINSEEKFQKIFGWGGAFTDATAINVMSLSANAQSNLLESYFSDNGIEYSLCRVPIGGTDFSTRSYSYCDGTEPDYQLKNFTLQVEDLEYKIPLIKIAQNLTHNKLKFLASAWTAPDWMKTNGKPYGFLGFLKFSAYQSWSDYFVKFLDYYQKFGIGFWGITTGNEPSLAFLPTKKINTVGWLPQTVSHWISGYLGPTLKNSNHSNIKLIILDDQRFFLPWLVDIIMKNITTRNYIDGIAIHWYYDRVFSATLLNETIQKYPDKFLLATEACTGTGIFQDTVSLGSWYRGELYSNDIIDDTRNGVSGWVDWNMALNLQGGPTYIENFADSPIIVNKTSDEFYKEPMFYNLGHFSKFVPPDSIRIASNSFDEKTVKTVAFLRPDQGVALIILNKRDEAVTIAISNSIGTAVIDITAKSITTLLYW